MERVNVHYTVYDVYEECTMAEFGRSHIMGFKPEQGYGFFEFTKEKEEYFKPHKLKMLLHQVQELLLALYCRPISRKFGGRLKLVVYLCN